MKRLLFILLWCAGTILFADEHVPQDKKITMSPKEFGLLMLGLAIFATGIILLWFVAGWIAATIIMAGALVMVGSDPDFSLH
jgi:hypothetical protein